jgi:hypothetical protein
VSYPKDIDEMTEAELLGELRLRESRRANGWCDYCCHYSHESPCRFPKRHHDPRIVRDYENPVVEAIINRELE